MSPYHLFRELTVVYRENGETFPLKIVRFSEINMPQRLIVEVELPRKEKPLAAPER